MAKDLGVELIELDVDLRLLDIWAEADKIEEWDLETAAAFMRLSYGKGYEDALTENERATLHKEHGCKVPKRVAA